ncbi:MAG: hypothetical protein VB040_12970 [Propionibacterium sp.]|nr:hypothetical protein [Propionibacterium sp.]
MVGFVGWPVRLLLPLQDDAPILSVVEPQATLSEQLVDRHTLALCPVLQPRLQRRQLGLQFRLCGGLLLGLPGQPRDQLPLASGELVDDALGLVQLGRRRRRNWTRRGSLHARGSRSHGQAQTVGLELRTDTVDDLAGLGDDDVVPAVAGAQPLRPGIAGHVRQLERDALPTGVSPCLRGAVVGLDTLLLEHDAQAVHVGRSWVVQRDLDRVTDHVGITVLADRLGTPVLDGPVDRRITHRPGQHLRPQAVLVTPLGEPVVERLPHREHVAQITGLLLPGEIRLAVEFHVGIHRRVLDSVDVELRIRFAAQRLGAVGLRDVLHLDAGTMLGIEIDHTPERLGTLLRIVTVDLVQAEADNHMPGLRLAHLTALDGDVRRFARIGLDMAAPDQLVGGSLGAPADVLVGHALTPDVGGVLTVARHPPITPTVRPAVTHVRRGLTRLGERVRRLHRTRPAVRSVTPARGLELTGRSSRLAMLARGVQHALADLVRLLRGRVGQRARGVGDDQRLDRRHANASSTRETSVP